MKMINHENDQICQIPVEFDFAEVVLPFIYRRIYQ